ncbi:hypothetical protein HMPREF1979_01333 [Actinomyces johnsonii F0542]|uniref:Uncharacterized protein n=1 Tax=Actinomyces johnsonii F0542 TaxID=1321818 RepID=U1QQL5_9ACTO|nr:hypothetical protein HMPREF1979_01333 [Actinomyces johnsonii F0542]
MRLPGFGPERADLVALMVYDCPRFIFHAYARRLLRQAGYEMGRGYEDARRTHEAAMTGSGLGIDRHKDFHGLIIAACQRARAAGGRRDNDAGLMRPHRGSRAGTWQTIRARFQPAPGATYRDNACRTHDDPWKATGQ